MDTTVYTNSNSEFFRLRTPAPRSDSRDPYDGLRLWSALTHGAGVFLAILGTVLLLLKAIFSGGDGWQLLSFSVYGASMICLYTASTLYHSVNGSVRKRVALRTYDHISIYYLIAGTYTPICLVSLRGPWGWSLFGIIWALAIAGTVMTLLWFNCPRTLAAAIYIAMGWLAVVALYPIWQVMGSAGLFWLLLGGVLYTIGGVLYAVKWPGRNNPRFGCHEIFHVFVVLGSIAHFMLIYCVIA